MFSVDDLRIFVIRDTLNTLGENSLAAENLLLGTAAQESQMGINLRENRHLGLYHITPATHRAIWDKYLIHNPDRASKTRGLAGQRSFLKSPHGELVTNLKYATAIAWLVYERTGKALPEADDIEGMARFWHKYFHPRPAVCYEAFVANYHRWVAPEAAIAA